MKYQKIDFICKVICFSLLTIAMTIFMFSNKNYNKVVHKIIDFNDRNVESVYLRVCDVYGQDNQKSLSEFFSEKDALNRMKEFNSILKNRFDYLEFDTQSLLSKEKLNFKDEFRIDYGTDYFGMNDKYGIYLFSAQVGKRAYEFFNLENQIAEGRGFETNDFISNNKIVPAILGYEYLKLINLGSTITLNYLSKDISVQVIGFFKKDTSLTINNNIYFLDKYITIPSLDVNFKPENKVDERFQNILYSLKNWGYIKIKDGEDFYIYKNQVDEISSRLGLKYFVNEGHVYQYIRNISNTINSSKGAFLIASIFLFLVLSAIFTYIHIWNYNRNKKAYAIHLICGCSFPKLKLGIYFRVLAQFILSFALSAYINKILSGYNIIYKSERLLLDKAMNQTAVLTTIIMIGICIVLNISFNKANIYASIRKED